MSKDNMQLKINKYIWLTLFNEAKSLQTFLEYFNHLRGRMFLKTYIVDGSQKRIPKKQTKL